MSKYQARRGHSVTVVTPKGSNNGSVSHDGFAVLRFPAIRDPFGNPLMPGMFRYMRENWDHFDIVHVHSQLFFSSLLALWSRHADELPAVLTCHGVRSASVPFVLSDLYLRTVTRAVLSRIQGILCYSTADARLLGQLAHASASRIHVVPNGVPLDVFRPSTPPELKEPVIIWAGRMVRHKGLGLLLKAVKSLVHSVPGLKLVMVGSGPEFPRVTAEIERLGLRACVNLIGNQPFEAMPRLYDQSAVCVVPSTTEGMPRTLMEAAATGVPVVASRLPQLSKFAGRGVLLFEPGSLSGLEEGLGHVLADSTYANRLSSEGRKLAVDEFDWSRTVEKTSDLCESISSRGDMVA